MPESDGWTAQFVQLPQDRRTVDAEHRVARESASASMSTRSALAVAYQVFQRVTSTSSRQNYRASFAAKASVADRQSSRRSQYGLWRSVNLTTNWAGRFLQSHQSPATGAAHHPCGFGQAAA
ncbi:MAG: hypothetical protein R2706_18295 [Acidimicrobiales bacterium]